MVIPAMVYDVYEQKTITQILKTQSTLSNAYKMLRSVYGPPEDWQNVSVQHNHELIVNRFRPFLKIMHDCKVDGNNELCILNNNYYNFNGALNHELEDRYDLVLADGSSVFFNNKKSYGQAIYIYIDLNGVNPPNRWGYDLFEFELSNDKILPTGSGGSNDRSILNNCLSYGYHCTAWIVLHHNIDYRRCPDDLLMFERTSCF